MDFCFSRSTAVHRGVLCVWTKPLCCVKEVDHYAVAFGGLGFLIRALGDLSMNLGGIKRSFHRAVISSLLWKPAALKGFVTSPPSLPWNVSSCCSSVSLLRSLPWLNCWQLNGIYYTPVFWSNLRTWLLYISYYSQSFQRKKEIGKRNK